MIRKIFILIIICCLFLVGNTQQYISTSNIDKKYLKDFRLSKKLIRSGSFNKAEKKLLKLLDKNPNFIDAHITLGGLYYQTSDLLKAEDHFLHAYKLHPGYDTRLAYSLATVLRIQEKYEEAIDYYRKYLLSCTESGRKCANAEKYLSKSIFAAEALKNPIPFSPTALGNAINSKHSEYLASFTADGAQFIFTRRVNNQEDFYQSFFRDGQFSEATPLTELNTPYNEGAHCISADGKLIIFTACEYRDSYGGCDLYYAELKDGKWTTAKNMGPDINSKAWDAQPSLSGDGKTLYFVSKRPGGIGKSDIWQSQIASNGFWAKAQNVGSPINTSANESSPFIHSDNQSLYFRSDGHPGIGGYDLFLSRKKLSDQKWHSVKNLGYPINTAGDEGALSVSLDGNFAFFASDRKPLIGSSKNLDIYRFELAPDIKPIPSTYVKIAVKDGNTLIPLNASIVITDLHEESQYFNGEVDEKGTLLLPIPAGSNYYIQISAPNYIYHSEHMKLESLHRALDPFHFEIMLFQLPKKTGESNLTAEAIILENIFFESNSAKLRNESYTEINRLAEYLQNYQNITIKILGHTDNVGSEIDNLQLSESRAKSVYNALMELGINKSRLSFLGKGESDPLDTNDTEEGRQKNRRTEFVIQSM